MTPGTDYSHLRTDELIDRLRAARTDDRQRAKAAGLLCQAHQALKDRGMLPADALAVLIGDHAQAVAVMRAAGRVAEATGGG
jgi:hypothetical protein